jgi:hypothetical protein
MYHDSAKEIVQTADELLVEIARHPADASRRQGVAPKPPAPASSPSPRP